MTDKRFQQINLPSDVIDIKSGKIYHTLSGNDGYGLCNLLNELHEENINLHLQNDFLKDENRHMRDLVNENKQLKQRNNRQAKRLGELYELMAKKDWKSLTEIIDDFKRCEEQLQRESGTYW